MYLNLAAAWKDLAQLLDDGGLSEDLVKLARKMFYGGAHETLCIQRSIMEMHEGKAATILLEALLDEATDFVREAREAVEAVEE